MTTRREIAQLLAKNAINVVEKTTSQKCVDHRDLTSLSQSIDSRKPRQANGKCTHKCRVHEINECQNDMEDLSEQIQSLFYS